MSIDPRDQVSELEKRLQAQFDPTKAQRFSSTAKKEAASSYIEQLVLPEGERGPVPYTKEDFVVNDNPLRVAWEKEVRKFLSRLPQRTSHRVTAPMIYEWATGIKIKDLEEADKRNELLTEEAPGMRAQTNMGRLNVHLRHINWVLKTYFGKPYKTKIMGREVGRAYTVRQDFRVKLKKPANISLWADWKEGTLNP